MRPHAASPRETSCLSRAGAKLLPRVVIRRVPTRARGSEPAGRPAKDAAALLRALLLPPASGALRLVRPDGAVARRAARCGERAAHGWRARGGDERRAAWRRPVLQPFEQGGGDVALRER